MHFNTSIPFSQKYFAVCYINWWVAFSLADLSSGLDADLRKLRDTYNKLKKEYDQTKEKLKFYEKVRLY